MALVGRSQPRRTDGRELQAAGATCKSGSKKGAVVGSGGQRRRGLEAKGPTPKAEERTGHPASRRAASAQRRADAKPRRDAAVGEVVVGRNPVVEALRAAAPSSALTVVALVDPDDRVTEAVNWRPTSGYR